MPYRPEVFRQGTWHMLGFFKTDEAAQGCVKTHQESDGPYKHNRVRIATVIGPDNAVVNVRYIWSKDQKMEARRKAQEAKEKALGLREVQIM